MRPDPAHGLIIRKGRSAHAWHDYNLNGLSRDDFHEVVDVARERNCDSAHHARLIDRLVREGKATEHVEAA